MSNITRYDPFNELSRINPLLSDPFSGDFFNRFMMRPFGAVEPQIRMDVKEADGQYLVNAEIPGVRKEDIHVSIDGKRVSISAEVKQEKETREGERLISCERSYGTAQRSFNLGCEIDQEAVKASYNNGVLELTLPKKPGSGRLEIPIS